ncbi:MAG: hypothetical protein J6Q41_05860, partial [Firmicutes bacterium]|nr:hypothetical protein [Bacillota bacterium]
MPLIEKVGQALRTYLPASPFVLTAALSGGRDSVCLLSALKDLLPEGVKLQAVHVNHHLRADADRDEAFCRELCEKWRIPFFAARLSDEQKNVLRAA